MDRGGLTNVVSVETSLKIRRKEKTSDNLFGATFVFYAKKVNSSGG
jgi:hypothetical protein